MHSPESANFFLNSEWAITFPRQLVSGYEQKKHGKEGKNFGHSFPRYKKSRSHPTCKQASILLQHDRQRYQRVSPTILDLIIIINLFTWASLTKENLMYLQIWTLYFSNIFSKRDNHFFNLPTVCIGLNIRGLFRAQLHVRDQEVSDDLLNSLQSK